MGSPVAVDKRSAAEDGGCGENGARTGTATGAGLALPRGNMGQCDGAVSAGVCACVREEAGGADAMAQWCAPWRRQQAGSDASSSSPAWRATVSGPRPKNRTNRMESARRICGLSYMNFGMIRISGKHVALRYHRCNLNS